MQVDMDSFYVRVVGKCIFSKLTTNTRLLVASERNLSV